MALVVISINTYMFSKTVVCQSKDSEHNIALADGMKVQARC